MNKCNYSKYIAGRSRPDCFGASIFALPQRVQWYWKFSQICQVSENMLNPAKMLNHHHKNFIPSLQLENIRVQFLFSGKPSRRLQIDQTLIVPYKTTSCLHNIRITETHHRCFDSDKFRCQVTKFRCQVNMKTKGDYKPHSNVTHLIWPTCTCFRIICLTIAPGKTIISVLRSFPLKVQNKLMCSCIPDVSSIEEISLLSTSCQNKELLKCQKFFL